MKERKGCWGRDPCHPALVAEQGSFLQASWHVGLEVMGQIGSRPPGTKVESKSKGGRQEGQ